MKEPENKILTCWFTRGRDLAERKVVYVRKTLTLKTGQKVHINKYVGDPECADCLFCLLDTATPEICRECVEDRIERVLNP